MTKAEIQFKIDEIGQQISKNFSKLLAGKIGDRTFEERDDKLRAEQDIYKEMKKNLTHD